MDKLAAGPLLPGRTRSLLRPPDQVVQPTTLEVEQAPLVILDQRHQRCRDHNDCAELGTDHRGLLGKLVCGFAGGIVNAAGGVGSESTVFTVVDGSAAAWATSTSVRWRIWPSCVAMISACAAVSRDSSGPGSLARRRLASASDARVLADTASSGWAWRRLRNAGRTTNSARRAPPPPHGRSRRVPGSRPRRAPGAVRDGDAELLAPAMPSDGVRSAAQAVAKDAPRDPREAPRSALANLDERVRASLALRCNKAVFSLSSASFSRIRHAESPESAHCLRSPRSYPSHAAPPAQYYLPIA